MEATSILVIAGVNQRRPFIIDQKLVVPVNSLLPGLPSF
jgi:hypothetical protein